MRSIDFGSGYPDIRISNIPILCTPEPLPRKGVAPSIAYRRQQWQVFLSQVQGFSKDSLKKVETQITSPDGKKVNVIYT